MSYPYLLPKNVIKCRWYGQQPDLSDFHLTRLILHVCKADHYNEIFFDKDYHLPLEEWEKIAFQRCPLLILYQWRILKYHLRKFVALATAFADELQTFSFPTRRK